MKEDNTINIDELVQDANNFNKGTEEGQKLMERSFKELGAGRSILVDKDGKLIAGNKSQLAAQAAGIKKVRVIESDGTELIAVKRTDLSIDSAEGRKLALADNLTTQVNLAWDEIQLQSVKDELGAEFDLEEWNVDGFVPQDLLPSELMREKNEEEELERMKREFEEKMAAGELDEDDPEYQAFLQKFEAKKTTDDCYTPELVYDAIANWVANEYNLNRSDFVRPFYPGGDYQKEKYKKNTIVVDNPPFSILSEILTFYTERGIRFFLFGPHLTIINSIKEKCASIPVGVVITYENGAKVNTSFATNLEPKSVRFRASASLYKAVKDADDLNQKSTKAELPKYVYPKHLVTAPFLSALSRYGIDFVGCTDETCFIKQLDSQVEHKKAIFGSGYLISSRLVAEREKAEREKAEREKAEREKATTWELSERELAIISQMEASHKKEK